MVGFKSKSFRALGAAAALACSAFCGGAAAQVLSDELQIVPIGSTTPIFTATVNDPSTGFEPIIAYANVTGGMDYSSTLSPTFVTGTGASASFNLTGATAWFTHQKGTGTFLEGVLTEPGSSTTDSDVLLSFMATVGTSTVNAVALISDPTLVSDIMTINTALGIKPGSTPETGALQTIPSSLLFTGTAPFTVNVLSAVPEPGAWMALACGLGALALAYRHRLR